MNILPRDSLFDVDRFFNRFMAPASAQKELADSFFTPRIDITEHDDKYVISAELAGVKKDDINVTLEDGVLTLQASVDTEKTDEKEGQTIRKERFSGSYLRSFNVGAGVTEADIKARFEDGVLELTVPKPQQQEPEKKRIAIQ